MDLNYADLVHVIDEEPAVACQKDPELFFAEHPRDHERAKRLCLRCPLRTGCLAGALARREPWGIWGGELVIDGVVTAHKRGRGRPPKTAVAA